MHAQRTEVKDSTFMLAKEVIDSNNIKLFPVCRILLHELKTNKRQMFELTQKSVFL